MYLLFRLALHVRYILDSISECNDDDEMDGKMLELLPSETILESRSYDGIHFFINIEDDQLSEKTL